MKIVQITSNTIARATGTTQYASGDLVANSATAGSVTPFVFRLQYGPGFVLHKVQLDKSTASVTTAAFRIHLYKDSPTVANGDNVAWSSTASGYQGFVDIAAPGTAFSNTYSASGVYVNNSVFAPLYLVSDKDKFIYGLIEARGAYTPASEETFTIHLIGQAYV